MSLYKIPNSTDIMGCGRTNMYYDVNLDIYAVRLDSMLGMPPPISVDPISSVIPSIHKLYQNYPNPFNPVTTIRFGVPVTESDPKPVSVQLKVYDILGKELAVLVNESLKPGSYEVKFDGTNFASGMYFYSLESGLFRETKKMVLVK